jgi:glycosyltransferase involved in cell wall biosynthesis
LKGVHFEFAAVLGVKDEREVLPHCIAHLRGIGVGRIMAIDCGSTDGSLEWLQENASDLLQVTRFSDLDPDAAAWERLNMRLAGEANADWVLFLDADEFWIPASGSLRHVDGLADADLLRVDRFNVAVGPAGPLAGPDGLPSDPGQLSLIVDPVPEFRSRLESEPELPWIRGVPLPKIMARASAIGGLADGGHDLSAHPGRELRRVKPADLLVAHLPFSNLPRFQRKLDNIRQVFDVHDEYFGAHMAWHWRRWLALEDADAVRREFERQCFDEATLRNFRESGVVQQATEWFQARQRELLDVA